MIKYYTRVINGKVTGSPIALDTTDVRISWPGMTEVSNFEDYHSYKMIIKSASVQNGKVVYIFEDKNTDNTFVNRAKAYKKEKIKAKYSECQVAGYIVNNIKLDGKDADIAHLNEQLNLAVANEVATVVVRDYNNSYHTMTVEQFRQLILQLSQVRLECLWTKWEKDQEVDACTTVDAVNAIILE
jgi:hypothetical protein